MIGPLMPHIDMTAMLPIRRLVAQRAMHDIDRRPHARRLSTTHVRQIDVNRRTGARKLISIHILVLAMKLFHGNYRRQRRAGTMLHYI